MGGRFLIVPVGRIRPTIKTDKLKRTLKSTIGLSSSYWAEPVNIFAKKNLESVFSMRDIRRTFKTLSGTLHFTENEKDIVNQHANKIIGKNIMTDMIILLRNVKPR
jgi:hypothetical protein